jgi:peptidoglycan/xylan/chitin deacetylase (PgdA/CDA1 family)
MMQTTKSNLDSLARKAAKLAVLPGGITTSARPGDVVILIYHRVGVQAREIGLPAADFDAQLSYLRERKSAVSLEDALDEGSGGGVVVTFDDGNSDFHEHALPLLQRHGVPALLYLATASPEGDRTPTLPPGEGLSWSQLEEAVATGLVTVGSHTHSHLPLTDVSEETAEEELRRSKELVEDRLGVACRHFAYPFARGSDEADRVARRLFDTVAVDAWRTNRRGRIDPYRLGRTPVLRSDGPMFFRAKARGRLDLEASLYRAFGRGPWRQP